MAGGLPAPTHLRRTQHIAPQRLSRVWVSGHCLRRAPAAPSQIRPDLARERVARTRPSRLAAATPRPAAARHRTSIRCTCRRPARPPSGQRAPRQPTTPAQEAVPRQPHPELRGASSPPPPMPGEGGEEERGRWRRSRVCPRSPAGTTRGEERGKKKSNLSQKISFVRSLFDILSFISSNCCLKIVFVLPTSFLYSK